MTTAPEISAVELAQSYTHRWPAQENSIRDFLVSLGLDTNHGFAKERIENSEGAKIRGALERKLAKAKRLADGARERMAKAQERSRKAGQQTKEKLARLARLSAARRQLGAATGAARSRAVGQDGDRARAGPDSLGSLPAIQTASRAHLSHSMGCLRARLLPATFPAAGVRRSEARRSV